MTHEMKCELCGYQETVVQTDLLEMSLNPLNGWMCFPHPNKTALCPSCVAKVSALAQKAGTNWVAVKKSLDNIFNALNANDIALNQAIAYELDNRAKLDETKQSLEEAISKLIPLLACDLD